MLPPGFLLRGLLLPATILGVALALGWWRGGRKGAAAHGLAWPGPLAVALGWAVGFHASNGAWPRFPPGRATEMLCYLGVFAGVLGASEGLRRVERGPVPGWSRLPFALVAPWLLLRVLAARWEAADAALQLGGASLFLWWSWMSFEAVARRGTGYLAPCLLWCVATAGSVAFLWSGSALYAQFAGTLAGFCGAALVVSLVRPGLSLARGTAGAIGIVFACLCIGAVHLAELPPAAGALLGLAPAAALVTLRAADGPRAAGARGMRGALLALVLVAVPLAVALYLAHLAAPPPDPYAG